MQLQQIIFDAVATEILDSGVLSRVSGHLDLSGLLLPTSISKINVDTMKALDLKFSSWLRKRHIFWLGASMPRSDTPALSAEELSFSPDSAQVQDSFTNTGPSFEDDNISQRCVLPRTRQGQETVMAANMEKMRKVASKRLSEIGERVRQLQESLAEVSCMDTLKLVGQRSKAAVEQESRMLNASISDNPSDKSNFAVGLDSVGVY